jgi:iron complex transport system ATP-binding protein
MSTLDIDGLTLCAGPRTLIAGLDWRAAAGQCWAIIGRNGAGKSTLLRTLAGLRQPEGGRVALDGRPLGEWPLAELARRRAYLPQSRADAFGYRVLDTVLSARHPYAGDAVWEDEQDLAGAMAALAAMEVDDLAARDVRTLSGGERQRVAIAGLLAQDTPLLLLDEPASALDLAHQVAIMDLLGKLCREQGKCVLLVAHDLNQAWAAATDVLLLAGDGHWQAGARDAMMQPALLSACLGHPIESHLLGERRIFLPAEPGT